MKLKSLTLIALTTVTTAGCALPPVGPTEDLTSTKYVVREDTSPQPAGQRNISSKAVVLDDQFVALGTASLVSKNAAVTQTWFIDKVANKLVVCSAVANAVNIFCRTTLLPIK